MKKLTEFITYKAKNCEDCIHPHTQTATRPSGEHFRAKTFVRDPDWNFWDDNLTPI
jgi:AhpD family alkylhydroperoxidase